MLPAWQKAEDSFLNGFSTIRRLTWGDAYVWQGYPEWPKFSFIRIRDAKVAPEVLRAEIARFKAEFGGDATEFYLRVPRELQVEPATLSGFAKDPDTIVSLSYDPAECGDPALASRLTLAPCRDESSLRLWWEVNSDARGRKDPFKSVLWPPILSKLSNGTDFYLLMDGAKAVTCGAIERFDEGYNSWGLGTRLADQKKGYSRAFMTKLAECHGNRLFSQVDLGEPRHGLLCRLPSTRILATEDLYLC
jgi:hypothetical protein